MAIWNDFVSPKATTTILREREKPGKVRILQLRRLVWANGGRNWGNNEYDLAHGFFMEFIRTGNRDYYRLAITRGAPSG